MISNQTIRLLRFWWRIGGSDKDDRIKQELQKLLDRLPEDCTFEDLHYQLYVLDKIKRAEAELASGAGIPHEEVKGRLDLPQINESI